MSNATITPAEVRALAVRSGSLVPSEKRHKYNAAPREERTWNGITFDSKKEMTIAQGYDVLLKAGALKRVDRQVRFPLVVAGVHICTLVVDFRLVYPDGRMEAVEVKGYETRDWKIKHKLFQALYPKWKLIVVK